MRTERYYTAERVGQGHPDKVCDAISDIVLDEYLTIDPTARVAVETLGSKEGIVIAGEVTSKVPVMHDHLRSKINDYLRHVGYYDELPVEFRLVSQSPEIAQAVLADGHADETELGAGDQGIVVGYASNRAFFKYLPADFGWCTHLLQVHKDANKSLTPRTLTTHECALGLDFKVQVTTDSMTDGVPLHIVMSTSHDPSISVDTVRTELKDGILQMLKDSRMCTKSMPQIDINPAGAWHQYGFASDTGLTGRKIVADAYGPSVPVGGGAWSGKDPTKVDRSGALFARWIARQIVQKFAVEQALVSLAYVIGKPSPSFIDVAYTEAFSYDEHDEIINYAQRLVELYGSVSSMIKLFNLRDPMWKLYAASGPFASNTAPWEVRGAAI
jgi:S-adenosylmethionine synthetase